jgi:hypothetical protein
MRCESPTGTVHLVAETDERRYRDFNSAGSVTHETRYHWKRTACNHRVGWGFNSEFHEWPATTKPVTCKRCLLVVERSETKGEAV